MATNANIEPEKSKLTEDEIKQLSVIALYASSETQFLIKLIERLSSTTITPVERDWQSKDPGRGKYIDPSRIVT